MRVSSRLYVLEYKCNIAGKFLKLSVSKEGNRAFVIFPAGWNDKDWVIIFEAIFVILDQSALELDLHWKGISDQALRSRRDAVGALPLPLPLGCCPQCGFAGNQLVSFALLLRFCLLRLLLRLWG